MITQGKWHVDGHNLTSVISEQTDYLSYQTYQHVCSCNYGFADPEKHFELNKNNAKLISKTPEMFELLKCFIKANPNDSSYNYQSCISKAMEIIIDIEGKL